MNKKFLIYMDSFDPSSGGQVAMHKLCHDINSLGFEAYTTSNNTHPKLNAKHLPAGQSRRDYVVVYPEIVHGNPLHMTNVVRWILNTPGVCGGVGEGFYDSIEDADLIYKYSTFFECACKYRGIMRTTFIDYEIFYNRGLQRDIKECFLIKKKGIQKKYHSDNAIDLGTVQHQWHLAAELFNRCEIFYCYDNECFWVTLAALCGCVVVVIPNSELSSNEWKCHFPFNKYGIAFGIDEIDWAKSTSDLVYDHCIQTQREDLETVKNMIEECNRICV